MSDTSQCLASIKSRNPFNTSMRWVCVAPLSQVRNNGTARGLTVSVWQDAVQNQATDTKVPTLQHCKPLPPWNDRTTQVRERRVAWGWSNGPLEAKQFPLAWKEDSMSTGKGISKQKLRKYFQIWDVPNKKNVIYPVVSRKTEKLSKYGKQKTN